MRIVALDLGARRTGVAVSDSAAVLASPYGVVERTGDEATDLAHLAAVVAETEAELVVVGLPLSLSGDEGEAARAARAKAGALGTVVSVPVELFDERLTTVEAGRRRREREAGGKRRERKAAGERVRIGREGIDAEAAAILLEAYIARRRGQG